MYIQKCTMYYDVGIYRNVFLVQQRWRNVRKTANQSLGKSWPFGHNLQLQWSVWWATGPSGTCDRLIWHSNSCTMWKLTACMGTLEDMKLGCTRVVSETEFIDRCLMKATQIEVQWYRPTAKVDLYISSNLLFIRDIKQRPSVLINTQTMVSVFVSVLFQMWMKHTSWRQVTNLHLSGNKQ